MIDYERCKPIIRRLKQSITGILGFLLCAFLFSCNSTSSIPSKGASEWTKALPTESTATQFLDEPCSSDPIRGRQRIQTGPIDAADWNRDVLMAWGLTPLSELKSDASHTEIRIWPNTGLGYPRLLLRLVGNPPHVYGELLGWWFSSSPGDKSESPSMEQFMAGLHCKGRVTRGRFNVCRFCPAKNEDWPSIWAKLSDLGIWSLPNGDFGNPREVNGELLVQADGNGVTIEVLKEGRYNIFNYSLWDNESTPLGKQAESIFDLVSDLRPNIH